jgi:tetratricopeptide (TPR) repeat protein
MTILERLQIAFNSPIGSIFFAMLGFLCLLVGIYWILRFQQKKKDFLAYRFQAYFEKVDAAISGFQFIGSHKADFWGRQTPVHFENGRYGMCLVLTPELNEDKVKTSFKCFQRVLDGSQMPLIAPYIYSSLDEVFVLVQGGIVRSDARPLLSLQHYYADNRLTLAEKEKILLELAHFLNKLHDLEVEEGGKLYHGLFLPRNIFIDFEPDKTISKVVVAEAGLAFAVGPEIMQQRFKGLMEGNLPIDKFNALQLFEQLAMLAPEQTNAEHVQHVGPAVDFYAFGTLAVTLFSQKRFVDNKNIEWPLVPQQWRPFLVACLCDSSNLRPRDFLEIDDWLNDPELALTLQGSQLNNNLLLDSEQSVEADAFRENESLDSFILHPIPQDVSLLPNHLSQPQLDAFVKAMNEGRLALLIPRLDIAQKAFQEALEYAPQNPEASVKLAIVYYKLGDLKNSEHYYQIAKQHNPRLAKKFREHIAFRV